MARLALLVLLLANIGYFAWSQGWLRDFGLAPEQQSEPQRIAQQIRPEALRIVARASGSGDEPAGRPQAAAAAGSCLQAGPFDDSEAAALEAALQRTLPEGRWRLDPVQQGTRWIVQQVDEAARDSASRAGDGNGKEVSGAPSSSAETHDEPPPGGSPQGFDSEAAAHRQLEALAARGIVSTRIVQQRAPASARRLTLIDVDAALRERLRALEPVLAGKPLEPCGPASASIAKP